MLTLTDTTVTMNSREIAELTGKRHDHVMRDIKNQLDKQNIGYPNFEDSYKSIQNKDVPCFSLDYEQTMILVTGYSIPLRAKVIKRWTELEQQNKPSYAIEDPIKRAEKWIEEQKQVQALSIKAKVADELTSKDGLHLPSNVGKVVSGHSNNFCQWLVDEKIMYRKDGILLPMARYTDKYFKVKISTYKNKTKEQAYFTSRGVAWIEAKYLKSHDMLQLGYKES